MKQSDTTLIISTLYLTKETAKLSMLKTNQTILKCPRAAVSWFTYGIHYSTYLTIEPSAYNKIPCDIAFVTSRLEFLIVDSYIMNLTTHTLPDMLKNTSFRGLSRVSTSFRQGFTRQMDEPRFFNLTASVIVTLTGS